MENHPPRGPLKIQVSSVFFLILIFGSGTHSTLQLTKPRWVLLRTSDGALLAENSTYQQAPTLTFDLTQLFGNGDICTSLYGHLWVTQGGRGPHTYGECPKLEIEKLLWHTPHYGCPEPSKAKNTCGDSGDLYCRHWGCETLALTWEPTGGQDPAYGSTDIPPLGLNNASRRLVQARYYHCTKPVRPWMDYWKNLGARLTHGRERLGDSIYHPETAG